MSPLYTVTAAERGQAGDIALLIATTFKDLKVANWLVPKDEKLRVEIMAAQFELLVRHAFVHGRVYAALDGMAAAVWMHREQDTPMPPIDGYEEKLAAICGDHLPRFQALDKAFETHHPAYPHDHLMFLAVDARVQGHLIGSTLLTHHLTRLDKEGRRAYLEATAPRSQRLYLRNGFINLSPALQLPDGGPEMYPMERTPRRGRGAR